MIRTFTSPEIGTALRRIEDFCGGGTCEQNSYPWDLRRGFKLLPIESMGI